MKDIFYGIGDFFTWTFGLLDSVGNLPNILFILIISSLLVYWMVRLVKYGEKANYYWLKKKD